MDTEESSCEKRDAILQGIAIAEIEQYICYFVETEKEVAPIFYLKELKDLYIKRMEFHGCSNRYDHSTRFKDKILGLVPELTE